MKKSAIQFLAFDTETLNVNVPEKNDWKSEYRQRIIERIHGVVRDELGYIPKPLDKHNAVLRSIQSVLYSPEDLYNDPENGDFTCNTDNLKALYDKVVINDAHTIEQRLRDIIDNMGVERGKSHEIPVAPNIIAVGWNSEKFDIPVLNAGTNGALWRLLLEKDPAPTVIVDAGNRIKHAKFKWRVGNDKKHSRECTFQIIDAMKTYHIGNAKSLANNAKLAKPWTRWNDFYKTDEYDYLQTYPVEEVSKHIPLTPEEEHYSKMDVVLLAGIIAYKSFLIMHDWHLTLNEMKSDGLRLIKNYWLQCFSDTMVNRYTTDISALKALDTYIDAKSSERTLANITHFKNHLYEQEETPENYEIMHNARGGGQITIDWLHWMQHIKHWYSLDDSSHYPYVMLNFPYPSRYPKLISKENYADNFHDELETARKHFYAVVDLVINSRTMHNVNALIPQYPRDGTRQGERAYMYDLSISDVRWHYTNRLNPCYSIGDGVKVTNLKTIAGKLFSADKLEHLTLDYPTLVILLDNYDFTIDSINFYRCGNWVNIATYIKRQILTEGTRKTNAKSFKKWAGKNSNEEIKKRIEKENLPIIYTDERDELLKRIGDYYNACKIGLNALYGGQYQIHERFRAYVNNGEIVIEDTAKYTPKRNEKTEEQNGHDYIAGMFTASWGRVIINTVGNFVYDKYPNVCVLYQHTDSIKIASSDGTELGMEYVDGIAKEIDKIIPHCKESNDLGFGHFENETDGYHENVVVCGHGQYIAGDTRDGYGKPCDALHATWLGINMERALKQLKVKSDLSNLDELLPAGAKVTVPTENGKTLRTSFDLKCAGTYLPECDLYTVPVIRSTNEFTFQPNFEEVRTELKDAGIL